MVTMLPFVLWVCFAVSAPGGQANAVARHGSSSSGMRSGISGSAGKVSRRTSSVRRVITLKRMGTSAYSGEREQKTRVPSFRVLGLD